MILILTLLLFQKPIQDDFIFDGLNEILSISLDCVDNEEIILCSKLGSLIFKMSVGNEKSMNIFIESIFSMMNTNEYLDMLAGLIYFCFEENDDIHLEDLKMIVLNVIIKVLRQDSILGKRFVAFSIYNFLGKSKVFTDVFQQSLIFLQSSLLEKPSTDYLFSMLL